jgi:uncharacterized lipoprotein YmbA
MDSEQPKWAQELGKHLIKSLTVEIGKNKTVATVNDKFEVEVKHFCNNIELQNFDSKNNI